MRRLLLLPLLTAFLTLPGLTAGPASALPCPGPAGGFGEQLEQASYVFAGKVTRIEKGDEEEAYSITVTRVYAGSGVPKHETVYAGTQPPGCFTLDGIKPGQKWLFLAEGELDRLQTTPDSASREFTADVLDKVKKKLGNGDKPAPDAVEEPPAAEFTNVAEDGPEDFWPLSLPGFVLVGAGLIVLAAARGLSRRADRHG